MPPGDQARPKPRSAAQVVARIAEQFTLGERNAQARMERVSCHRLSPEEYAYTLQDLLGVTFDATDPAGLPEDPAWPING